MTITQAQRQYLMDTRGIDVGYAELLGTPRNPPGTIIDAKKLTASPANVTTAAASLDAGLVSTQTYDGSPIEVIFFAPLVTLNAGNTLCILALGLDGIQVEQDTVIGASTQGGKAVIYWQGTPTPGIHTFNIVGQTGATTATLTAGALLPITLTIRRAG